MTMIQHQAKEEHYVISDQESGIVSRDVHVGENRDEWQELYRYQVRTGEAFVFRPEDTFSIYQEYLSDAVDFALADDGTVFTDETTEANEATDDDMTLLPATEVADDAYYFGYRYPWGRLRLDLTTAGVGTAIVWEYYNGTTWATVPGLVDGTTGLTETAGLYNISFTPPGDWARTTVSGKEAYFIRLRCTTASFTTIPLGGTAFINGGSMELLNTDRFRIEIRDSSEESRRRILGPIRYVNCKEFQDVTKKAVLSIAREQVAKAGEWIVVQVLPQAGIVDVSAGYFALECQRIRDGF